MSRILISGGTVVAATGSFPADVAIDGERIVSLFEPGSTLLGHFNADTVIDATGKLVVPGGVDVHTHMEMPSAGTVSADTFETGTLAAAWGGTTTIVDFAGQARGSGLREAWEAEMAKAEGRCVIDFGLHMIVSDVNDSSLAEMDGMVQEGVTSFKLFMAYPGVLYSDDGQILRAMQKAAQCAATIMMHAENGIAIDVLVSQALRRDERDPKYHASSRPSILEGEATHRAIVLAQVAGAPLYIVHLSAAEALAEVVAARDTGALVHAETCPQYLFLSEGSLDQPSFEGAKFVCSPPLRGSSHHEDLWRGLAGGDLSVVATDHCPFCFKGQKELGRGDFSRIPNGLPGVEHRMELIYQGVVEGRISQERWVELTSTAPARLFGMYPAKGVIQPGADADLVVFDPTTVHTVSAASHHMAVDYSCYEGLDLTGRVETVVSRGRVLVERGAFVGVLGGGRYLKRSAPPAHL
ncbi:MAG: dihydropyrimidinase [Acidimicrobiales bacterium]